MDNILFGANIDMNLTKGPERADAEDRARVLCTLLGIDKVITELKNEYDAWFETTNPSLAPLNSWVCSIDCIA